MTVEPQAAIDLDRYFERIGYTGAAAADLATLTELHERHPAAIAFENLTPLLGQPVPLDIRSLERKLVQERRGGYCYEHNLLFAEILKTLGFRITGLAARVLWNQPEDVVTPRSHMLMLVDIGGESHVADVGFGGLTLTAPLRLEVGVEQETPHETFRIAAAGPDYLMQAKVKDEWKTLYRFDLQRQFPVDYEMSNYYLSTNDRSHFRHNLLAARAEPGRRLALFNTQFAVHDLNGGTERRTLASAGEIRDVLTDVFGIAVPETGAQSAFERLAQKAGV